MIVYVFQQTLSKSVTTSVSRKRIRHIRVPKIETWNKTKTHKILKIIQISYICVPKSEIWNLKPQTPLENNCIIEFLFATFSFEFLTPLKSPQGDNSF
jgi:hypothetical protein